MDHVGSTVSSIARAVYGSAVSVGSSIGAHAQDMASTVTETVASASGGAANRVWESSFDVAGKFSQWAKDSVIEIMPDLAVKAGQQFRALLETLIQAILASPEFAFSVFLRICFLTSLHLCLFPWLRSATESFLKSFCSTPRGRTRVSKFLDKAEIPLELIIILCIPNLWILRTAQFALKYQSLCEALMLMFIVGSLLRLSQNQSVEVSRCTSLSRYLIYIVRYHLLSMAVVAWCLYLLHSGPRLGAVGRLLYFQGSCIYSWFAVLLITVVGASFMLSFVPTLWSHLKADSHPVDVFAVLLVVMTRSLLGLPVLPLELFVLFMAWTSLPSSGEAGSLVESDGRSGSSVFTGLLVALMPQILYSCLIFGSLLDSVHSVLAMTFLLLWILYSAFPFLTMASVFVLVSLNLTAVLWRSLSALGVVVAAGKAILTGNRRGVAGGDLSDVCSPTMSWLSSLELLSPAFVVVGYHLLPYARSLLPSAFSHKGA